MTRGHEGKLFYVIPKTKYFNNLTCDLQKVFWFNIRVSK